MKLKLTKKHRRRFDDICRTIREVLHIEHWESKYTIKSKQPEDRSTLTAQNQCYAEGRRIWIVIFPYFYGLESNEQLRTLIHEHIHATMNPYNQVVGKIMDWSHDSDRRWVEMIETKVNENLTDHLTSVIYDLIYDRF
jgi:hypothetical protein